MKNKLLLVLFLTVSISHAQEKIQTPYPFSPDTRGLRFVPSSSLGVPDEFKKRAINIQNEIKTKGYRETHDQDRYLSFLFNLNQTAPQEIKENRNSKYGDYDTHLKINHEDIKLSIPFHGISFIPR
jgi:hypothetical protein